MNLERSRSRALVVGRGHGAACAGRWRRRGSGPARRFGISVGAYVRRLRLDWAAGELERSDMSLAEVALAAGFADQSHLPKEGHCTAATNGAPLRVEAPTAGEVDRQPNFKLADRLAR